MKETDYVTEWVSTRCSFCAFAGKCTTKTRCAILNKAKMHFSQTYFCTQEKCALQAETWATNTTSPHAETATEMYRAAISAQIPTLIHAYNAMREEWRANEKREIQAQCLREIAEWLKEFELTTLFNFYAYIQVPEEITATVIKQQEIEHT